MGHTGFKKYSGKWRSNPIGLECTCKHAGGSHNVSTVGWKMKTHWGKLIGWRGSLQDRLLISFQWVCDTLGVFYCTMETQRNSAAWIRSPNLWTSEALNLKHKRKWLRKHSLCSHLMALHTSSSCVMYWHSRIWSQKYALCCKSQYMKFEKIYNHTAVKL